MCSKPQILIAKLYTATSKQPMHSSWGHSPQIPCFIQRSTTGFISLPLDPPLGFIYGIIIYFMKCS